LATLEWLSWFNHHCLLEPLGYIPPAEAESNYSFRGPVRSAASRVPSALHHTLSSALYGISEQEVSCMALVM
jgi:hypothetical protein